MEILKQAYRRGVPPPDSMTNAPELRADLISFWQAYEMLSSCRGYAGMSGVPLMIPWTAINEYAIRHGYHGDMFDDLEQIIMTMDAAYCKHAREQAEKETAE